MSSVADYKGRTIDLLAFQGATATGEKLLSQVLVAEGESGQVTAGIQKLAQRWYLEMLTEMGTIPYDLLRGTGLMFDARNGIIRTTVEAEQSFALASKEAETNLILEEDTDMPEDERYGSITLDNVTVTADRVIYRATLRSLSGESREVLMPLTTTIG